MVETSVKEASIFLDVNGDSQWYFWWGHILTQKPKAALPMDVRAVIAFLIQHRFRDGNANIRSLSNALKRFCGSAISVRYSFSLNIVEGFVGRRTSESVHCQLVEK
jgi:hypothetical protein